MFFQLNHSKLTAEGQNTHLTWMDFKYLHVPSIRCLGFISFAFLWEIFSVKANWGWSFYRNELISPLSQEVGNLLKISDTDQLLY